MWHVCSLSLEWHPCSAWLSTFYLNVIFIPVFCQKINFLWVCGRAEHMATALRRWQPSGAGARRCRCPALAADAPGFSTIKWRSSLFSLSTAVPCTLKCSVNHCLPFPPKAAKALTKFEFSSHPLLSHKLIVWENRNSHPFCTLAVCYTCLLERYIRKLTCLNGVIPSLALFCCPFMFKSLCTHCLNAFSRLCLCSWTFLCGHFSTYMFFLFC